MEAMRAIAHGKPMLDEVMDKVNKQAYKVGLDLIIFSKKSFHSIKNNAQKSLVLSKAIDVVTKICAHAGCSRAIPEVQGPG